MNEANQAGPSSVKKWTEKHPIWSILIGVTLFVFLISSMIGDSTPTNNSVSTETPQVAEVSPATNKKVVDKTVATKTTPIKTATTPAPVTSPTPTPVVGTKTDREKAIEIIKANASAKWGTDYEMVNYTVKNQTVAYDWVVKQTQHLDIMARAKTKWQNDYEMIKYIYENQVAAYNWMVSKTAYPDIMTRAKQKWGGDYEMVKYEYENQVAAYEAQ